MFPLDKKVIWLLTHTPVQINNDRRPARSHPTSPHPATVNLRESDTSVTRQAKVKSRCSLQKWHPVTREWPNLCFCSILPRLSIPPSTTPPRLLRVLFLYLYIVRFNVPKWILYPTRALQRTRLWPCGADLPGQAVGIQGGTSNPCPLHFHQEHPPPKFNRRYHASIWAQKKHACMCVHGNYLVAYSPKESQLRQCRSTPPTDEVMVSKKNISGISLTDSLPWVLTIDEHARCTRKSSAFLLIHRFTHSAQQFTWMSHTQALGEAQMRSTPSLGSFPDVVFQTVLMLSPPPWDKA